jgi:uncharacterized phage-associated protein
MAEEVLGELKQSNRAILIARYFLMKKEKSPDKALDHKKLQKLVYYAQAWNLVFNKKPLFGDDIQAWIHGPAIPNVWFQFKDFDFTVDHPEVLKEDFSGITKEELEVLDRVWNVYGKYDGNYLEMLTHNELPWQEARKSIPNIEPSQNIISIELMKSYYEQRLEAAK